MKRLSESIFNAGIKRNQGEEIRKEDKTSNRDEIKFVDMGCSVLWADRDYKLYGSYLLSFMDADIELFAILKRYGMRLPTLKEVDELWKKTRDSYTDHHLTNNGNELIFEKRGLYKESAHSMIDENAYYYGWTADKYDNGSHHIFTFDRNQMYLSPINDSSVVKQVIEDNRDKLCMRLVKDK